MIYKGFKKPLVQEEMWRLSKANQTQHISDRLDAQLINIKKEKLNIIWPIFRMFWTRLLFIAMIKLIPSCLTFASPIILNELIGFMKYGKSFIQLLIIILFESCLTYVL
jgi:hypothetical protein